MMRLVAHHVEGLLVLATILRAHQNLEEAEILIPRDQKDLDQEEEYQAETVQKTQYQQK